MNPPFPPDPAPARDEDPRPSPGRSKPSSLPHDSQNLPAVTPLVDKNQIRHFVTQIKSAEQQIGEHIIAALQDDKTVAVLTAVVMDPSGGQRIVSAALDPEMLQEVQRILQKAEQERDEEIPCVGFHCLLRHRQEEQEQGDDSAT